MRGRLKGRRRRSHVVSTYICIFVWSLKLICNVCLVFLQKLSLMGIGQIRVHRLEVTRDNLWILFWMTLRELLLF